VLALIGVLSLATYVVFTYRVATYSAIKGTYLSPGLAPFCLFAGLGLDRFARRGRRAAGGVAVLLGIYVASVLAIFWSGWLAPTQRNDAFFHIRAHSDAATQRVTRFFIGQWRPRQGDPGARD
jgi:hypothetical protein